MAETGYTTLQMEYISSVDGSAHITAVNIIGEAEAKIKELERNLKEARRANKKLLEEKTKLLQDIPKSFLGG